MIESHKTAITPKKYGCHQQGAALIVSLIILLIMTILGVSNFQTTTFEEKMTGNLRDKAMAFEAAEAVLREAETLIGNNINNLSGFDNDGSDGFYNNDLEKIWEQVDWDGSDSNNANKAISTVETPLPGVSDPPKYVIQHYASYAQNAGGQEYNLYNYGQQTTGSGDLHMFRITVRATGGSSNAVSILQTTFGKVF